MAIRMLYLMFVRLSGWLALLVRVNRVVPARELAEIVWLVVPLRKLAHEL